MKRNNKKCIVCGKEYSYCPTCRGDANQPAWRSIYCSENCKSIMDIATDYNASELIKADAKKKLSSCDLSNKKNFKDGIIKTINNILDTTHKNEKAESDVSNDKAKKEVVKRDIVE